MGQDQLPEAGAVGQSLRASRAEFTTETWSGLRPQPKRVFSRQSSVVSGQPENRFSPPPKGSQGIAQGRDALVAHPGRNRPPETYPEGVLRWGEVGREGGYNPFRVGALGGLKPRVRSLRSGPWAIPSIPFGEQKWRRTETPGTGQSHLPKFAQRTRKSRIGSTEFCDPIDQRDTPTVTPLVLRLFSARQGASRAEDSGTPQMA